MLSTNKSAGTERSGLATGVALAGRATLAPLALALATLAALAALATLATLAGRRSRAGKGGWMLHQNVSRTSVVKRCKNIF